MKKCEFYFYTCSRLKGRNRFIGKYVIGRRKRFGPYKVYPFVRMNAEISKTIKAKKLGLGMQILEILARLKFVSAGYPL